MPEQFESTSDNRAGKNVMRHQYRTLSEAEKENMCAIKDLGAQFHHHLENMEPSREISIAKTKVEEAVMWACKHITK
ncbi:Acb2/Tad1 domain-containing protein [Nitrospina gracilis]|uniref:Acb2/Tad1 domain-containing protein n=1 Tax=Nitrospina gracilis TaxID=35801 RepID=UPI001F31DD4B|nr:hypothetical protein [Nitrospina gracilis]MCF8719200.1 hypothetical protein [Nitrospina gracilis Nb-211]